MITFTLILLVIGVVMLVLTDVYTTGVYFCILAVLGLRLVCPTAAVVVGSCLTAIAVGVMVYLMQNASSYWMWAFVLFIALGTATIVVSVRLLYSFCFLS